MPFFKQVMLKAKQASRAQRFTFGSLVGGFVATSTATGLLAIDDNSIHESAQGGLVAGLLAAPTIGLSAAFPKPMLFLGTAIGISAVKSYKDTLDMHRNIVNGKNRVTLK